MFDKKTSNNQRGSFLINVLVSVSILALAMTLSIPHLRRYQPNMKLNAVARDLTADLRQAQQLTITEQVVHQVEMDFGNDEYSLIRTGAPTTTIKTVEFPVEVSYQQIIGLTGNKVIFNSYGGVSESGQVVLDNINGKLSIVTIKPSGYIQLYQ